MKHLSNVLRHGQPCSFMASSLSPRAALLMPSLPDRKDYSSMSWHTFCLRHVWRAVGDVPVYLKKVNLGNVTLVHETGDGSDWTHAILTALKEVVCHLASLQLLLFLHMTGGIARHCRIVPKHQLSLFMAHCLWNHMHLQCTIHVSSHQFTPCLVAGAVVEKQLLGTTANG